MGPRVGGAMPCAVGPGGSSIRSELDYVGHLVVLGIDDDDLLRSEEEPVAFHLRDLLADVARHRPRADARRYRLTGPRRKRGRGRPPWPHPVFYPRRRVRRKIVLVRRAEPRL